MNTALPFANIILRMQCISSMLELSHYNASANAANRSYMNDRCARVCRFKALPDNTVHCDAMYMYMCMCQHTLLIHTVCVCTLLFPVTVLYLPMHTISSLTQLEIWSTLGAILHRSLSNIHMCRQLHLIHHCLDYLRKTTSDKVAS